MFLEKFFLINSLIKKFEFIAPELLLKEVRKREDSLIKEIGISKKEWDEILNFILEEIDFIPADEFIDFLPEAEKICKDPKDKEYVALALAFKCPIFSGDPDLREIKEIKVYSPRELLEILIGERDL